LVCVAVNLAIGEWGDEVFYKIAASAPTVGGARKSSGYGKRELEKNRFVENSFWLTI